MPDTPHIRLARPVQALPAGAQHTRRLIDTIRAAERPVTIPGISAARGARRQDIEHTAFELERQFAQALTAARALIANLNENLTVRLIDADSFLSDTFQGAADLVSDIRARSDMEAEAREFDR